MVDEVVDVPPIFPLIVMPVMTPGYVVVVVVVEEVEVTVVEPPSVVVVPSSLTSGILEIEAVASVQTLLTSFSRALMSSSLSLVDLPLFKSESSSVNLVIFFS